MLTLFMLFIECYVIFKIFSIKLKKKTDAKFVWVIFTRIIQKNLVLISILREF